MSKQVSINLPVANLPKSVAFFEALGFAHNPHFTNDSGACIVVSGTISIMLLTHARFRDVTPKAICDTRLVNGVDFIKWNDACQIVESKVMLRPLKAINVIHQRMAAMRQSGDH